MSDPRVRAPEGQHIGYRSGCVCRVCSEDPLRALESKLAALEAEVAPLRAYRAAYFAHHAAEMRANREYEHRKRAAVTDEDEAAFEKWCDEQYDVHHPADPRESLHYRLIMAKSALTGEEHWPADYAALVAEMRAEFGDD